MKKNYINQRFASLVSFLMRIRVPSKLIYFTLGIVSTIWFLIRVIPKPSRVHYPCMKAAAPLASSFVVYLLGITSFSFLFKKARQRIYQSRYLLGVIFIILGLAAGGWTIYHTNALATAEPDPQPPQAGNEPIGVAKGIFPGRVVWEYNPDATNENCTNNTGDFWYMDKNTDQSVVNKMLSRSIHKLTGTSSDVVAWDSLFHFYNRNHERGNVGYTPGEKVAIKINLNGINNSNPNKNINTSPQICYAILDQLVNVVGVAQTDISIGDPNCSMNQATYTKCHNTFANVTYWGSGAGLTYAAPSASAVLHASDGSFDDVLPQAYLDATYLINIPVFKKHHRAGISICCKNHFGSIGAYTGGAWHLHASLPCMNQSGGGGIVNNGEYGVYRCFVDIMGHEDLGGKTVLFLVDGIWGSVNWGHPPVKWHMTPFNDDWPSSLFVSLDPVAIESVCFDFLYEEFDIDESETLHPEEGGTWSDNSGPFPHFPGTDDYLHQAADPNNWPAGIEYDPENDGTILGSMGTHEHWNNAIEKQYTRNLGTGNGIELYKDGVNEQFTPENSGLLSDKVTSIYVDSFDIKWFATDMGVSRYDGSTWSELTTESDVASGNGILSNNIRKLAYERTAYGHELWMATDSGLSVAGFTVDGVSSATTYNMHNSGIIDNNVLAVGVDARHNRWAGTPAGISVYRGSDWYDTTTFLSENHGWDTLTDVTITSMGSYEKDSMIFVATNGAGVLRYGFDLIDGFTGASAMASQWSKLSDTVNSITITDTVQWFGTDKGAFRHLGNNSRQNWLNYTVDSGLISNDVRAIEVDDSGNVWFGTDIGLSIKTADGWLKYPAGIQASGIDATAGFTDADISWINGTGIVEDMGLVGPVVNDIKKDFNGNIWVATNGGIELFATVPGMSVTNVAKRVVFITEGNSGTVSLVNGTTYVANSVYGNGSNVGGWYCIFNDTTDSVVVTGLVENTTYRVMVCEYTGGAGNQIYVTSTSTGNPANFTTQFHVSIDPMTDVTLRVYPVPFNEYIIINGSKLHAESRAYIYSIDGRLQYTTLLEGNVNRINTTGLKAGSYVLRIDDGDKSYTVKIVK
jgi:hypothetical protein